MEAVEAVEAVAMEAVAAVEEAPSFLLATRLSCAAGTRPLTLTPTLILTLAPT